MNLSPKEYMTKKLISTALVLCTLVLPLTAYADPSDNQFPGRKASVENLLEEDRQKEKEKKADSNEPNSDPLPLVAPSSPSSMPKLAFLDLRVNGDFNYFTESRNIVTASEGLKTAFDIELAKKAANFNYVSRHQMLPYMGQIGLREEEMPDPSFCQELHKLTGVDYLVFGTIYVLRQQLSLSLGQSLMLALPISRSPQMVMNHDCQLVILDCATGRQVASFPSATTTELVSSKTKFKLNIFSHAKTLQVNPSETEVVTAINKVASTMADQVYAADIHPEPCPVKATGEVKEILLRPAVDLANQYIAGAAEVIDTIDPIISFKIINSKTALKLYEKRSIFSGDIMKPVNEYLALVDYSSALLKEAYLLRGKLIRAMIISLKENNNNNQIMATEIDKNKEDIQKINQLIAQNNAQALQQAVKIFVSKSKEQSQNPKATVDPTQPKPQILASQPIPKEDQQKTVVELNKAKEEAAAEVGDFNSRFKPADETEDPEETDTREFNIAQNRNIVDFTRMKLYSAKFMQIALYFAAVEDRLRSIDEKILYHQAEISLTKLDGLEKGMYLEVVRKEPKNAEINAKLQDTITAETETEVKNETKNTVENEAKNEDENTSENEAENEDEIVKVAVLKVKYVDNAHAICDIIRANGPLKKGDTVNVI